jgi:hypothetical protein
MLYYVVAWYLIGVLCWILFEAQDGNITLFNLIQAILFGILEYLYQLFISS